MYMYKLYIYIYIVPLRGPQMGKPLRWAWQKHVCADKQASVQVPVPPNPMRGGGYRSTIHSVGFEDFIKSQLASRSQLSRPNVAQIWPGVSRISEIMQLLISTEGLQLFVCTGVEGADFGGAGAAAPEFSIYYICINRYKYI